MEIDEEALRVEMTETEKEDGSKILVPMLYANIPIKSVKRVSEEEN